MTPATETVVLLNSLATRAALWDDVIRALPEHVVAVVFDQRDQQAGEAEAFTLDDMVADAVCALDERGVERAHVAGVSLGGIVALHAAATRPDRFASVTAMCCAARFPREVWIERAAAVRAEGVAPLAPAILDRWFTAAFQEAYPAVVERCAAMLAATPDEGYARACDLLAAADVRGELAGIAQPALIVSGEVDTANPVAHQEGIVAGIPGAAHAVVPGAGHLVPASHPDAVARLLVDHIGGRGDPTSR
ncbi:alpha/beta fold hydrolase [Microbacterium halophytorum]|uniref:alpha/beta fold hydrolase n=1 Tax=Microbacterium halophytorum TaxID=2067568 RepID=UPI001319E13F|nr:alpha/beta fold hydrolase [Microbacterium halophytorum]